MVRTVTFRYSMPGKDVGHAVATIKRLALFRSRLNRGLYGVDTRIDGEDLLVSFRIDGHTYWEANGRARTEAEIVARVLRMQPGSVVLEREQTEPSMRSLTVESGRVQSYENRSETRRKNKKARLDAFRARNVEWLGQ